MREEEENLGLVLLLQG